MVMILFDRVTKIYPGDSKPALEDVSLHIEPNEFVFIVGKSGAGKSTLIKTITKEEIPTSGKVVVGGIDLDFVKKRHIPNYRRRLGVVFQDYKLLPTRTVFENVAFALEIAGMSNRDIRRTVPKVLELVGLTEQAQKFPRQLSGGQQQRVSIARSVARQPKILIADEPTGNLDKLTRQEIVNLLQKINEFGTTVLVTTHDESIVNLLHKRVITLKDGRIVSDQKHDGIYTLDKFANNNGLQIPGARYNGGAAARSLQAQQAQNSATRSIRTAPVASPSHAGRANSNAASRPSDGGGGGVAGRPGNASNAPGMGGIRPTTPPRRSVVPGVAHPDRGDHSHRTQ